jgi:hypothetical protein
MASLTSWGELRGVPYEGVPVGTIKRHATGKGNANKQAMIDAARATGDVADYPQEMLDRIGQALVSYDGVPTPTQHGVDAEPGSVVVTLTLIYPTEPPADAAHDALKPLVDDPAALEAFLRANGIDIDLTGEADITIPRAPGSDEPIDPSGQEPTPRGRSPAFWPVVITAIVVALLLILLAVVYLVYRNKAAAKARAEDAGADAKSAARPLAVRRTTPPQSSSLGSSPRGEDEADARAPPPAADVDRI